jgi:hypothetical protein
VLVVCACDSSSASPSSPCTDHGGTCVDHGGCTGKGYPYCAEEPSDGWCGLASRDNGEACPSSNDSCCVPRDDGSSPCTDHGATCVPVGACPAGTTQTGLWACQPGIYVQCCRPIGGADASVD